MIKKLTLTLTILAATLVARPATAQIDAAPEAIDGAPAAFDAGTDSETTKPATAPESEAEAPESEDDGEDLGALGKETFDLAKGGKWLAALGALMFFLVALFRKVIFKRVDWFQTKTGGYAAAGGIAFATIVGLSIKLGFSIDVVLAGLSAAGLATGLHTAANDAKGDKIKPSPES